MSLAAQRELEKRRSEIVARFTAEAYSTTRDGKTHDKQLKLLKSAAERVLVYCTPRAGKTRAVLWILAATALGCPDTSSLYIGITAEQASRIAWRPWKRILREAGLYPNHCTHSEQQMSTTFANGSVVYFSGAQDVGSGLVFLGDSYAGGVVVLDEVQDRSDAVIVPLVEDIIEERLNDITEEHPKPGRLICIGTIPRAQGGWFWRQITETENSPWERHSWSRLENPFLKGQKEALAKWLKDRKITLDDEITRRNWFAEPKWTHGAGRPYRYEAARNSYKPIRPAWADGIETRSGTIVCSEAWPGVTDAICAIDLGGADRASIQVIGYGETVQVVQHLFDWTSERDAHYSWGELLPILGVVAQRYNTVRWVYDSDASKTEHDTLGRDYGIPLIAAANKSEMVSQIRRVTDLLLRGKLKIMEGSHVEDDFQRAAWDTRELAKGKWKLAIGPNKVDASEAFRYAVGEWFDISRAPKVPKTPEQQLLISLQTETEHREPVPYGYQDDPELSKWIGESHGYGGPD